VCDWEDVSRGVGFVCGELWEFWVFFLLFLVEVCGSSWLKFFRSWILGFWCLSAGGCVSVWNIILISFWCTF